MNISKMRVVADRLRDSGRYEDASVIYSEVRDRIWCLFGTAQIELTEFSQRYLSNTLKNTIQFRNSYSTQAMAYLFGKWFSLDSDQTYNEFLFTTYGRIQCMCSSLALCATVTPEDIFNEFLLMYTLVLHNGEDEWIGSVNKILSPVLEGERLKKVRPTFTEQNVKRMLITEATKINNTDWACVNASLLDYLTNTGDLTSALYDSINKLVGPFAFKYKYQKRRPYEKTSQGPESERKYNTYEKYERYEKYEHYEKYEKRAPGKEQGFDFAKATEAERAKYFGDLLGLKGKVTKAQIRKRYIEMIAQYHPDKVEGLGAELKELAEQKTKEINVAYDWMKSRYNL